MKNLKMSVEEWNKVQIQDISQKITPTFTSRDRQLPQEAGPNTPHLVMYVDRHAMKHHKAILSIAKLQREHSNDMIQTTVRTGKYDFHIRTRPRGSNTPWADIAPVQITQDIPNFKIGAYRDIVNPNNNPEEPQEDWMEDQEEPMEDIQEITEEVDRLNKTEEKNKRDRTADNISQGRRKAAKNKSNQTLGDSSSPEASAE